MLALLYLSVTVLLGAGVLGSLGYLLALVGAGACAPRKGGSHER